MALPSTLRGKCGRTILKELPVIRLLSGGEVVVSGAGLCRIVCQPGSETVWELVGREFAHQCVAERELVNLKHPESWWYEAIDYTTGKVLNFDNRGLSDDRRERSYQLHHFTCRMHADEDTVKVQRKIYHRAKGFKLGRLLPGPAKKRTEPVKLFKPKNERKRPFRSASKKKQAS